MVSAKITLVLEMIKKQVLELPLNNSPGNKETFKAILNDFGGMV